MKRHPPAYAHMLVEGYIKKLERGVDKFVGNETFSNPDLAIVAPKG